MQDVSLVAAFVAGLLSVTSPCVLPLIPIYLAHLGGVAIGERRGAARRRVLLSALAFVLGFSAVFVLLGLSVGALGGVLADDRVWLVRFGGVLMIVMGLHLIGVVHLAFLERQRRLEVAPRAGSVGRVASSLAVGAAFGAGWTPCVGPILGAILTLAVGQANAREAGVLLAVYAAGLAVPFLATAAAFGTAPGIVRWVNRRMAPISAFSGAVILALGVVLLLGIEQRLFAELAGLAPWTPWEPNL